MCESSPQKHLPAIAASGILVLLTGISSLAASIETTSPLTTVAAIRHLTPQVAERGLPVKLRGVISYNAPGFWQMFIQDETGGIYVHPNGLPPRLNQLPAGTLVEVEGITNPGRFAPNIEGRDGNPISLKPLGETALPEPLRVTKDQLADPQNHCLWIEVGGMVRGFRMFPSADESKCKSVLTVGPGNARFVAVIYGPAARDQSLRELVGAQVRMRGVYGSEFNERRQLLGMRLLVTSRREILVDGGSGGSPFLLPTRAIGSLMQFSADSDRSPRAHVRGIVTLVSGRGSFYMQDETAGLWVTGEELPQLQPGDTVDVGGFPALGAWNPVLDDAEVHAEGGGPLPAAKSLSIADAFSGDHCFQRAALEAELIQTSRQESQPALVLKAGGQFFLARFATSIRQPSPQLEDGSLLRLTGICLNEADPQIEPRPAPSQPNQLARTALFELLLASPDDVVVLRPPPWWTIPRLAGIVAVLLTVLCAAALWVVLLRRKIAAQTVVIRERLAREAVYDERTRIARELHDTLEQEITGIAMHIDVATALLVQSPDTARQSLDTARLLLDRSRTESRRSIWELRSTALEQGGLTAAFAEQTSESRREGGPHIEFSVDGPPRRLPAKTEIHLFRIGHEALTNAIKHSHAQHIAMRLCFDDEEVSVAVEDDGGGFDLPINGAARNGHFGLLGMRERAAKIQARFEIDSARGRGTRVAAVVHIPAAQRAIP